MLSNSNLPPGVTPADIERAQGTDVESFPPYIKHIPAENLNGLGVVNERRLPEPEPATSDEPFPVTVRLTADALRIGLFVMANREFSGVDKGTSGQVVERSNSWPDCESVAVQWNRYDGDTLTDWFAFDELRFLDII